MDFISKIFGWEEEEEEEEPEFLVLGAQLSCTAGDQYSYLFVDTEDIQLDHLPEACVADNEAFVNIFPSGSVRVQ